MEEMAKAAVQELGIRCPSRRLWKRVSDICKRSLEPSSSIIPYEGGREAFAIPIFGIDFEAVIVIDRNMLLRLLRNRLIYVILILYVLIPMLDSMVCADCLGNAPFQGETTIGHLQAPHDDVSYSSKDDASSKIPSEQSTKFLCSICANVLLGVEVFSLHKHLFIAPYDGQQAVPALPVLHYSINKPPQNPLV